MDAFGRFGGLNRISISLPKCYLHAPFLFHTILGLRGRILATKAGVLATSFPPARSSSSLLIPLSKRERENQKEEEEERKEVITETTEGGIWGIITEREESNDVKFHIILSRRRVVETLPNTFYNSPSCLWLVLFVGWPHETTR